MMEKQKRYTYRELYLMAIRNGLPIDQYGVSIRVWYTMSKEVRKLVFVTPTFIEIHDSFGNVHMIDLSESEEGQDAETYYMPIQKVRVASEVR